MKRLALTYIAANILDLVLTLHVIQNGAVELNPVMRYFLNGDLLTLVLFKVGLAAVFAVVLCAFRWRTVLRIATIGTSCYCAINILGMLV
jgi:hypothetical protein